MEQYTVPRSKCSMVMSIVFSASAFISGIVLLAATARARTYYVSELKALGIVAAIFGMLLSLFAIIFACLPYGKWQQMKTCHAICIVFFFLLQAFYCVIGTEFQKILIHPANMTCMAFGALGYILSYCVYPWRPECAENFPVTEQQKYMPPPQTQPIMPAMNYPPRNYAPMGDYPALNNP